MCLDKVVHRRGTAFCTLVQRVVAQLLELGEKVIIATRNLCSYH